MSKKDQIKVQDIREISDHQLESYLFDRRYKLGEKEISTVNFVFWTITYLEKRIQEVLLDLTQTRLANLPEYEMISDAFDELTFGSKINVFEKTLKRVAIDRKKFISILREMNQIRNLIAHNKISNLKYSGSLLSKREIKIKLISDISNSLYLRKQN